MSRDMLFELIDAVHTEFGVRTGRNEWLNIASVGDLHEHLCFVLRARTEEARAALWSRVAAMVGRATGIPAERIRPDSDFTEDSGISSRPSRPAS